MHLNLVQRPGDRRLRCHFLRYRELLRNAGSAAGAPSAAMLGRLLRFTGTVAATTSAGMKAFCHFLTGEHAEPVARKLCSRSFHFRFFR